MGDPGFGAGCGLELVVRNLHPRVLQLGQAAQVALQLGKVEVGRQFADGGKFGALAHGGEGGVTQIYPKVVETARDGRNKPDPVGGEDRNQGDGRRCGVAFGAPGMKDLHQPGIYTSASGPVKPGIAWYRPAERSGTHPRRLEFVPRTLQILQCNMNGKLVNRRLIKGKSAPRPSHCCYAAYALAEVANETYLSNHEAGQEPFSGGSRHRGNAVTINFLADAEPQILAGGRYVGESIMNILKQIGQIWNQYREFRSTFNELSQMSDAELRDMGLYRGDIVRVAYGEAETRSIPVVAARRQTAQKAQGGFGVLSGSH